MKIQTLRQLVAAHSPFDRELVHCLRIFWSGEAPIGEHRDPNLESDFAKGMRAGVKLAEQIYLECAEVHYDLCKKK